MDLQSPTIDPVTRPFWRDDFEAVFKYLEPYKGPKDFERAFIAVFLDPKYSLTELKRIAQAGVHFERAMAAMIPEIHPEGAEMIANWQENDRLQGLSKNQVFNMIESTKELKEFVNIMMSYDHGHHWEDYSQFFYWNFKSLLEPGSSYLRFQLAPELNTADLAINYTTLAVAFVEAAVVFADRPPKELMNKFEPDADGLGKFLRGEHS